MTWYMIELGLPAGAKARLEDLLKGFLEAHQRQGHPEDMSLLSRIDRTKGTLTLYLTPACEEFARSVPEAVPVERPIGQGLTVLAGGEVLSPNET